MIINLGGEDAVPLTGAPFKQKTLTVSSCYIKQSEKWFADFNQAFHNLLILFSFANGKWYCGQVRTERQIG